MKKRKMNAGFMMGAIACGLRAHKPRPKFRRRFGLALVGFFAVLIG